MNGEFRDTGSVAKIICPICHEDGKPTIEDLQSVSPCGHVFHELCLQQWLKYAPPNKKATCPICRHQCSEKDIHRLHFQSVSESTPQMCSKRSRDSDSEDTEELRANVKKLEEQLRVVTGDLDSHKKHITKISVRLSSCQHRARKAEDALAQAIRDKANSEDLLLRKQEELDKSTTQCAKLLEENVALTKELAAHKLSENPSHDSLAKMKATEEPLESKQNDKVKPSFELSGKLAAATNKVTSRALLFNEPPDARKPTIKWCLYALKGGEALTETIYINRQSCYLFGRERSVADVLIDHSSCSKQHAVIQFRQVEEEEPDGTVSKRVRPYLMDLRSSNGTRLNDNRLKPQHYYELSVKDTIKFGKYSQEYKIGAPIR